jgi:ribonuclease HI
MNKQQTIIFTDGASRGNPGPGGWGSVVIEGADSKGAAHITEVGGFEADTTNNRMEISASVGGLSKTRPDSSVLVYTDSSYLINGITKWIHGWKRNGWLTKTKGEVLNRDLWEKLHELTSTRRVEWKYVGGHVGILGNERCDHIATAFADERDDIKLFKGKLADYDLPNILDISIDETKAATKKSSSSRSKASAFSYVSMVNGIVETHKTWAACEKRVKGTKGARYKKALNAVEEMEIMAEFKPRQNI